MAGAIGEELEAITVGMMQAGHKPTDPAIVQARRDHLQNLVDAAPSSGVKGRGDDMRAHAMFPSTKMEPDSWVELFDRRPDIMHALLGDLYRFTKMNEAEVKKTGRRPRAINGNLDELHAMLTPQFSHKPFGDAMRDLMGSTSLRAFAARIPMHHHQLTRLMNGERAIVKVHDPKGSMALLETIARAGKVHPAYFAEWRELYAWSVIQEVLVAKPNFSITLVKMLTKAREGKWR